ncbi:BamA/OMP85 family outer membrane protein [Calditrichota bacterium LG24]
MMKFKTLLAIASFFCFYFCWPQLAFADFVQSVHIKGKIPVPEKRLLKTLKLNNGSVFSPALLAHKEKELLRYLMRRGYLQARVDSVSVHSAAGDSTRKIITFFVNGGPEFRIRKIVVKSDSIAATEYEKVMELKSGRLFDQDVLQKDLKSMLRLAADHGHPFARVEVEKINTESANGRAEVDLQIRIREDRTIFIKDVVFNGLHYTRPEVVLRQILFKPGMRFSQSWLNKIEERIQRLQLFEQISPPMMARVAEDSVLIIMKLEEGSATSFDGVVGYVPPPANNANARGYLTGLIELSFRNLLGSGRKFKIFWEKTDRLSENFNFKYLEPWVLNYPIDAGLGFSREVRDTLYIAYDLQTTSQFNFNEMFSLFVNFNRHSVNPDSLASYELGLAKNRTYGLEIGIRYDTRDYPFNPRAGVFYQSSYTYGLKQNLGPAALIERDSLQKRVGLNSLSLQVEWYRQLFKLQVIALQFHLKRIKGSHLQLSDYFWFGGSGSVRGYRERQFNGYLVSWINVEYRFITGRNARVFLFTDFGYYKTIIQNMEREASIRGMGIGLRFRTPMGIMGVDYGLAQGESFRQGKIHVRLTSQF